MMVSPLSRKGALGDQKGPRMEEEVGSMSPSAMILLAISSTRLFGMLVLCVCYSTYTS